jgi:hypothetical protein
MNCFNIRELQGILKRKFFTDLVNNHDNRHLLEPAILGLRYKLNLNNNLEMNMFSFYNYGINTHSINSKVNFNEIAIRPIIGGTNYLFLSYFKSSAKEVFSDVVSFLYYTTLNISYSFLNLMSLLFSYTTLSFLCLPSLLLLSNTLFINLKINLYHLLFFIKNNYSISQSYPNYPTTKFDQFLFFNSQDLNNYNNLSINNYLESSNGQRYNRFSNALINYDYKTGNYIGGWEKQYPYLINSFIEVTRGIRKPS